MVAVEGFGFPPKFIIIIPSLGMIRREKLEVRDTHTVTILPVSILMVVYMNLLKRCIKEVT